MYVLSISFFLLPPSFISPFLHAPTRFLELTSLRYLSYHLPIELYVCGEEEEKEEEHKETKGRANRSRSVGPYNAI